MNHLKKANKNVCDVRTFLTSDHVADATVWVDTADLLGMRWVHLPTKDESWKIHTEIVRNTQ